MCGWFRQVAARGREGGLGACLQLSSYAGEVDGPEERAAASAGRGALQGEGSPQEQPWPEKPLFCGKAAPRPLVGRV